jgi:hypothetical protein
VIDAASPPAVRRTGLRDAEGLSVFAEQTPKGAYAGLNDPGDTELHCRASFGEAIRAAEIARPDMVTLLYEQDGSLAAVAQLAGARPRDVSWRKRRASGKRPAARRRDGASRS